jgi:hypothetical protein
MGTIIAILVVWIILSAILIVILSASSSKYSANHPEEGCAEKPENCGKTHQNKPSLAKSHHNS